MRKTLYLKFLIGYVLFAVFGFITVATFGARMSTDYALRIAARDLYEEAVRIADTYAADLYDSRISLDTAQSQAETLSAFMDTEIWVLNPSGRMVVNSAAAPDPQQEIIVEDFDPTVAQSSYYTVGRFFGSFDSDRLSVIAPIVSDYKIRGYVVIHMSMDRVAQTGDRLLNIAYAMLVVLLFLSLIILLFFTEIVYRPLRTIIRSTEQYAAGNYHYPLSIEGDDELSYLAASISYMADSVARSEDDQKKFIANVSHDFRSPLTSIRGFLEAMLDGTIPLESHDRYLKIVLNETDRLRGLTESLLTLNNLNTRGMLLQKSTFDINECLRGVAASFEQVCRSRDIRFRLVLSGSVLYTEADREKIQQVIYNLVDNAIKFSHDHSEIRLETTEKGGKIYVSVRDNGIGIPKSDQSQIWERFYKSDASRGKDKKGTGLGLSIVREIIRAHGENINLISTEGAGSTFVFSLPRSTVNDDRNAEGELPVVQESAESAPPSASQPSAPAASQSAPPAASQSTSQSAPPAS